MSLKKESRILLSAGQFLLLIEPPIFPSLVNGSRLTVGNASLSSPFLADVQVAFLDLLSS